MSRCRGVRPGPWKGASDVADGQTVKVGSEYAAESVTSFDIGQNRQPALQGSSDRYVGVVGNSDRSIGVGGNSASGTGVRGNSTSGYGVVGFTDSGTGVSVGQRISNVGVYGHGKSGLGVLGISSSGEGVSGRSTSNTGVSGSSKSGDGVVGRSKSNHGVVGYSDTGIGVRGDTKAHIGVAGIADVGIGVYGTTRYSGKPAILGVAQANNTGVQGYCGAFGTEPEAPRGTGVSGYAALDAGSQGVHGQSTSGRGVSGRATSGAGVRGEASTGTAVYAASDDPMKGYALRAQGRVKLDQCAGLATIAAGTRSVIVTPRIAIVTGSAVVATLQTSAGGTTTVHRCSVNATANTFTIHLTADSTVDVRVAWHVFG